MNKTGKYLFLLLALCLLLALLPVTAFATGTTEVSTWEGLQAALSAGGDIVLTGDVTAGWNDNALTIATGITATLDLNGHIVDRDLWSAKGSGYVFNIDNGSLTLTDSNPTATHDPAVVYKDPITAETVIVTGGVLTGGHDSQTGGGVYMKDGTFTMKGGSIVGNCAGDTDSWGPAGCGGGVYMQSGTFTMSGGAICGNMAVSKVLGGGKHGDGGGIYVNSGTFTLTGGEISGNEAGLKGGGVYLASTDSAHDGKINISGGATVTENTVGGADNNVYLEGSGVITVTDTLTGTLGVTMQTPGVFTSGLSGNGTKENFTSDDAGLVVSLTDGGEAQLKVEEYPLWVGGVQATSANKGDVLGDGTNVTYNPETQTLTFPENITLTGAYSNVVIYAVGQDLTIQAPNGLTLNNRDAIYGISTGSKALTVETGGVLAITVKDYGINAGIGGVTVTGNVNITVGQQGIMTHGPVTVTGDVTIRSGGTYGIDASGKVELNGNIDIEANGFCILTNGDIALDYGTCTLTSSSRYDIQGNNITLEGTSLTGVTQSSYYCVLANQKLTLVRGDFSFTGGRRAIQANGDIEIQSGVTRVYGKCTSTSDSVICAYNNGEIKLADSLRIVTPEDGYIDNTNYSKIVDKNGNNVTEVVIERLSTYSVTVTPGANMTLTSGAASQTVTAGGAMESVVYTADEGYYFPEDYTVDSVNGVAVTRDSFTQITVSGTPTGNAAITLTAPMAKTKPDAPTAAAEDCTTSDNNDGKLTGVTTAMEYKKSDAENWTAGAGSDIENLVPGTYYVRVKATDTTLASDNQELEIKEFISYTVTFKVVNGSWNEGEGDAATADKTVTLTGHDGDSLKLAADQIPAVGTKPNDTYKAGSWDTTPSADTVITGATTYTYTYAQKDTISQTVTFKVINGKWDDDTTADKTVTLTGYEGDTLKLAANQIPAVGDKPNGTYKAGSWDVTPSAETEITAATTYTYTYAAKETATVTKAPAAKTLTYNGSAQELVTAGTATGGEMQYALGTATEATQPYTTSIPTEIDAGTYYVWYKAKGDANHADSAPAGPVTVVIASRAAAEYTLTVRYVYQDGTQAAEPHTEKLTEGSPYSVASPAIAGFTPDAAAVSGVVGAADVNVTVTYTANPVADRTGKIELHGLDAVLAELAGIYGSLQQLKQAMLLRMTINKMPVVADQTVFYDVDLLVSLDGGITWSRATEENFPAEGLTVTLPYPEGTNGEDFDFCVSHMFTVTSARLGTKAGEVETPAVSLKAEGIQVILRGLSPVAVAWVRKGTPAPTPTVTPVLTDVPKTGDRANPGMWIVMVLAGAAVIGALLIRSKKKHHR